MMSAALPVDEDSVDLGAIRERMKQGLPPMDVQEYLWRVRLEAEEIPDVVVSDVDPRRYDIKQTANMPAMPAFNRDTDPSLLPSEAWKQNLLAEFAELRQLIARWQDLGPPKKERGSGSASAMPTTVLRMDVPRMNDSDGWSVFFFGRSVQELSCNDEPEGNHGEDSGDPTSDMAAMGTPPHLRLLLQFDQVLTRRLIRYHTEWLATIESMSRARAVWIYALLARLDKPVHADVAAVIRQLLRRCWQLRNTILDATDARLKSLNILISITGDYFGQLDDGDDTTTTTTTFQQ